MGIFDELMTDRVTIRTRAGETFDDVPAVVEKGMIVLERVDIPIQPGDEIRRATPTGSEEIFLVEDPGLVRGMLDIPDAYEIKVRRADTLEMKRRTQEGGMAPFDHFMRDRVSIRCQDGNVHEDVAAMVQKGTVTTKRTDIPIRPGDEVVRVTPAGVEEIFIVDDPGFNPGTSPGGHIPAMYHMSVSRADARPKAGTGTVIYAVSGQNARFNINSTDSSTNVIGLSRTDLFERLRVTIREGIPTPACENILRGVDDLERESGGAGFARKYAAFVGLAADHMSILAPFLPALTQFVG